MARIRQISWMDQVRKHKYKLLFSLVLLFVAQELVLLSGTYTTHAATTSAHDIVLDNLQVINLTPVFIWGFIGTTVLLTFYPLLRRVDKLHEVIFHFSLLVITRAVFICLTHLKVPPDAIPVQFPWPASTFAFTNDLFFSGHAVVPLVGFWVFRKEPVRYVFLALSALLSFTVLAMHEHYSIDVFAAFYIAYGTFRIGEWMEHKMGWLA